jgi:hypothetical protein
MVHFSLLSNSIQYVRLHPILISILLYDYKQLTECISEVERIETRVNSNKKKEKWSTMKKKEVPTATTTTLDNYFINTILHALIIVKNRNIC